MEELLHLNEVSIIYFILFYTEFGKCYVFPTDSVCTQMNVNILAIGIPQLNSRAFFN